MPSYLLYLLAAAFLWGLARWLQGLARTYGAIESVQVHRAMVHVACTEHVFFTCKKSLPLCSP